MNRTGMCIATLLLIGCDVTVDADIGAAESSFSASYSQTSDPVDPVCLEGVLTEGNGFEEVSGDEGVSSLRYKGYAIAITNNENELKVNAAINSASDVSVADITKSVLGKIEKACT